MVLRSRVDKDGFVTLRVPVGVADADREVVVTLEDASNESPQAMSREEWLEFIDRTAGSVTDPTFIRHPQGEFEERDCMP
jgi:hypothetical protein